MGIIITNIEWYSVISENSTKSSICPDYSTYCDHLFYQKYRLYIIVIKFQGFLVLMTHENDC